VSRLLQTFSFSLCPSLPDGMLTGSTVVSGGGPVGCLGRFELGMQGIGLDEQGEQNGYKSAGGADEEGDFVAAGFVEDASGRGRA